MKQRPMLERSFPLEDIAIRAGGTGRTVVAYAAMFGVPYEVTDFEGHYYEQIHRGGFNRAIDQGALIRAACLYNHGMTVHATPSERYSMPLGTPIEIRAETRGLLTVTEYLNTPLADEVLEGIRSGAIRSQSFRGPIMRSRIMGQHNGLRLVERGELGLKDYGPCLFPVNVNAEIVGVRSQALVEQLRELTPEEREELLAQVTGTPDLGDEAVPPATEDTQQEPAADAAPPAGPSLEVIEAQAAARRRRDGVYPQEGP